MPSDSILGAKVRASQVEMTAEALRQGTDAFVHELSLAARPWGFTPEDVKAEVVMWHGLEDRGAPVASAREVARRIPRCVANFVPGAGHFLHYDRWQAVLDSLLA